MTGTEHKLHQKSAEAKAMKQASFFREATSRRPLKKQLSYIFLDFSTMAFLPSFLHFTDTQA